MINLNSYMPVEIVSGKDCVKNFKGYSSFGTRCAVITGKNMYKKCPVIDHLKDALTANGVEFLILCEAENNPTPENVFSLAEKALEFKAQFIIGVGGGSSMDAAKAVALVMNNRGVTADTIFSFNYTNKPLPSIMIGTTAGTGSEVMPSSVLTIPGDKHPIKKSLKTRDSYGSVALCDPQYTHSLPLNYTVSTALDSICHALESMYSKKANDLTPIYAHKAIELVMPVLKKINDGAEINESMREDLYFGSVFAGLALNNGGTSCAHSLGYLLTTMHNVPHGTACAAFIGEFLIRTSKVKDVSETLNSLGFSSGEEFCIFVKTLNTKYSEIPALNDIQIKEYASEGFKMQSINNNLLNLSEEDCVDLYKNIF